MNDFLQSFCGMWLLISIGCFMIMLLLVANSSPAGKETPCPHGYEDWDDCPVCRH